MGVPTAIEFRAPLAAATEPLAKLDEAKLPLMNDII